MDDLLEYGEYSTVSVIPKGKTCQIFVSDDFNKSTNS